MLSSAVDQAIRPAPGAVPDATSIKAPGVGFSLDQGALGQALGVTQAFNKAAEQQMAADPMFQQLQAAQAEADAARDAAAAGIQARQAQRQEVMDRPLPALPEEPAMPTIGPAPTELPDNPLRMLGQYLPVLGALSSKNVQFNTVAALNAATGAMNAIQDDDQRALEAQHKAWMQNMELALKKHQLETERYNRALASRKSSMDEKLAELTMLAAANQDDIAMATLKTGKLDSFKNLIDFRNSTAQPMMQVYEQAQRADLARDQIASQEKIAAADRNAANWRAQLAASSSEAGKVSIGDIKAQLVLAAGQNPGGQFTPQQKAMWDRVIELEKNGSGGMDAAALAALMGGGAPAAEKPTAAAPEPKGPSALSRAASAVGKAFTRGAEAELTPPQAPSRFKPGQVLFQDGRRYVVDKQGNPVPG